MPPVEVVASIGAQDQEPLVADVPDEEPEQVATGPVGPMEILEDQDEWSRLRLSAQGSDDGIEQPCQPIGWFDPVNACRIERGSLEVRDQGPQIPPPTVRTRCP